MIQRIGSILLVVACVFALCAQKPAPANPAEAARLNNLGAAYMNQQLFEKALKNFQEAASLDPKLEMARLNQGIALLNLTRVDAARQVLEETVQRDPHDPHAWYNLGLLYKNSDKLQAAVDAFRRVTEIDPNDADSWYFLGASYVQVKQLPQALDAFQHALKLNPLHASAQFGLARALQQSGDSAGAREHLARFQHITQNKLGAAISLAYGEQGKYSLAEEAAGAPAKVPAQIAVSFVDVTKEAGIVTTSIEPTGSEDEAVALNPGACFLDYDNDGRVDLFLPDGGAFGGMSLYHNLGNGKFHDVSPNAGLDPKTHAIMCTSGDYDNDGFADLAVSAGKSVLLWHNEQNGSFKNVTEAAGLAGGGFAFGLAFVDYDHDGDLDLFVGGFTTVWRNNGNGTFTAVTGEVVPSREGAVMCSGNIIGSDINNDRATDFVAICPSGFPIVLLNPREGKFDGLPWRSSIAKFSQGVAILDFNHDGWIDLAFTTMGSPGLSLWKNNQGKAFEQESLPEINWVRAFGVAAFDYDNDGWVDLAAVGETKDGKGEIRLFRNLGPDGWKDVTTDVGLDKIQLKRPRALITADYDNDGDTDLLITQNQGPAVLLRNDGGNQNHWLKLSLKGLADNKSAIGTKVEVFAGGNRQKFEIAGSSGYLGQNSTDLVVGLGQAKQADVVRMLWPTGVLQDEVEVAGDKLQKFTEIDRRGSSCPTLFVWDGQRYALVADMLGAGVVGHWVGPGQRNIPRPTEYVKIDRQAIREKNGKLSFRFMEPLEEAVYLDQVRLLAVDHPASFDVYPNEYFASSPPYPEFKVVASSPKDAHPPAGAWDEHGHDVLPDLLAHRYFGDFELLPFAGFTKMHSLELDLGHPYRGGPLWLLMHGEIEYFSATSMYAADQAGLQPVAPYVEALGEDGKWTRVMDDMGFPAGGSRTMTANLTGKLPLGMKRIRISTNLQIYWDSILINRTSQNQMVGLTPVPLTRADLRFHGFPLKIENQPPGNVAYLYEKASPTGPYTRPEGSYTRYGDVLPLVTSFDDRLAVFGSGDEVALEFDPAKLPPLAKGAVRDYFFVANGYEKDMDFYAYSPTTAAPLPFRAMGTYPYPKGKSYPLDGAHLDDLLNYDTRYMSGNEARGYAFRYGAAK
ncbi:MAG TPA: FG-GAP-like repeat-containing protein [Terriglobales bacterium]|jgi:tetratricopeptide (TPR) repeat protein|nr:FG-GAP-like repeat-containing protein [Terriglobales bacterium]